jgi:hypothetical protein
MNRCGAPITLFVSGLLVLSACGSSTSATPGAGGTRSAAGTTSSPVASGSPESVHFGGYTLVFATPQPTSAAEAKVIEGFREGQILWDKSDIAWRLVAPVTDYVTGDALNHLTIAMTAGKAHDIVPAGTERLFMTRVTAITGRSAIVTTCDDGSKLTVVNPHTGQKVAFSASPNQAYILETWHMVRRSGHWAITAFSLAILPDSRAAPCQP